MGALLSLGHDVDSRYAEGAKGCLRWWGLVTNGWEITMVVTMSAATK